MALAVCQMDAFKNRFRDLQKQEDSSLALADVSHSMFSPSGRILLQLLGTCRALKYNGQQSC